MKWLNFKLVQDKRYIFIKTEYNTVTAFVVVARVALGGQFWIPHTQHHLVPAASSFFIIYDLSILCRVGQVPPAHLSYLTLDPFLYRILILPLNPFSLQRHLPLAINIGSLVSII